MSRRPRVLLTRPHGENDALAARLAERGIDAQAAPCVRIEELADLAPLADSLRRLTADDVLVITSRAGARAVARALRGTPCAAPAAAVGPATAHACREAGLRVAFMPSVATGIALADELPLPRGVVLLARSHRAAAEPAAILRRRGALVGEIVVYRTVPLAPDGIADADVAVFASPSAVDGFALSGAHAAVAVAVGPATAARVRERLGIDALVAAPDDVALAIAIERALEGRHAFVDR
ncbi:MAG TPA: uroporphyrinogen-III synthase [Candidatus Limnocylindria bacterium]